MHLPVTSFYAGLLALYCMKLSFNVVTKRHDKKVAFGDGGDKELVKVTRVSHRYS